MSVSEWSRAELEQHHREVYAPAKVAKGEQPRNFADYVRARERFSTSREVGAGWEAEVALRLELRPARGWRTQVFYDTDRGTRFHDHAADYRQTIAIEAKAGERPDATAERQLEKDAVLLADNGVAVWVVEDLDKLPPPALERARELEQRYPDTFVLREVTDLSRDRVFDEMQVLLRERELEHFELRVMDLGDDLALAREDREQHQARAGAAAVELGYDPASKQWTRALSPAEQERYAGLTGTVDRATAREREVGVELDGATALVGEVRGDLDAVRSRVAERESRLDREVARVREAYDDRDRRLTGAVERVAGTRERVDEALRSPTELAGDRERERSLIRDRDRLDEASKRLEQERSGRTGPPSREQVRADLERRDWYRQATGDDRVVAPTRIGARARRLGDPVRQAGRAVEAAEVDLSPQPGATALSGARRLAGPNNSRLGGPALDRVTRQRPVPRAGRTLAQRPRAR